MTKRIFGYSFLVSSVFFTVAGCSTHGGGSKGGGEAGASTGGSRGEAGNGGSLATGGTGGEGEDGSGGARASGGTHAAGGDGSGGNGGASGNGGGGGDGGFGAEGGAGSGGESASGGTSGNGGSPSSGGSGAEGGEAGSSGEDDCGCLDQELSWGNQGIAFVNYRDYGTLSGCNAFELRRHFVLVPRPDRFCTSELTECTEQLGVPDVLRALGHPDVQQALAMSPVQYGYRASDAGYHVIQVGERTLEFAEPCEGRENCSDPPSGVTALRTLLADLLAEQRAEEACASILGQ